MSLFSTFQIYVWVETHIPRRFYLTHLNKRLVLWTAVEQMCINLIKIAVFITFLQL
jgi:hypothetical protein